MKKYKQKINRINSKENRQKHIQTHSNTSNHQNMQTKIDTMKKWTCAASHTSGI